MQPNDANKNFNGICFNVIIHEITQKRLVIIRYKLVSNYIQSYIYKRHCLKIFNILQLITKQNLQVWESDWWRAIKMLTKNQVTIQKRHVVAEKMSYKWNFLVTSKTLHFFLKRRTKNGFISKGNKLQRSNGEIRYVSYDFDLK